MVIHQLVSTYVRTYFTQKYEDDYTQEILLNNDFNNFVRNYELAYWGPNTASHQIDSPLQTGNLTFPMCIAL